MKLLVKEIVKENGVYSSQNSLLVSSCYSNALFIRVTVSARVLAIWFSGCENFGLATCAGRCCSAQKVRELLAFVQRAGNLYYIEEIFSCN